MRSYTCKLHNWSGKEKRWYTKRKLEDERQWFVNVEGKKKMAIRETAVSNNYYKGRESKVCVGCSTKHRGTQG